MILQNMIQGYICIKAQTKDGFLLGLQRVSSGILNLGAQTAPPVLLLHGLFMGGDAWFMDSPNESLGFILADRGFDVWVGNIRGTKWSHAHESLSNRDKALGLLGMHQLNLKSTLYPSSLHRLTDSLSSRFLHRPLLLYNLFLFEVEGFDSTTIPFDFLQTHIIPSYRLININITHRRFGLGYACLRFYLTRTVAGSGIVHRTGQLKYFSSIISFFYQLRPSSFFLPPILLQTFSSHYFERNRHRGHKSNPHGFLIPL
ncbi:unnamed protein product [Lactuca virosa]|uniref:Partial AB-hydrolase lipase domain-containing protein n=1 Tax=Lactuca virosa TaxID=75947 RepID=A0AAU9P0L0_9ASTR|nr:unnamed protein product [Lactuca virosa]